MSAEVEEGYVRIMTPEKKALTDEIRAHLTGSNYVILADYLGLTVEQVSELRGKLRGRGATMRVTKNRLFRIVAAELGKTGLDAALIGPSAMVYGAGEDGIANVAKILKDFSREHGLPTVKMGVLNDGILTAADIEELADLPSREVLLARFVCAVAAPISQLASVANQKVCSLLYALQAVADKKSA